MKPKISVIISNRNDAPMLAVTVRSVIEELSALPYKGEVVIADNSDPFVFNKVKEAIPSGYIKEGTINLLHQDFPCIFTAREMAVEKAQGDYVLCLDSHMLCGRDMIGALVTFMDSKSQDQTVGFAHAPINWIHHHERQARHDRDMSKHELGDWNSYYKTNHLISWKGMPWICRRDWFLNKERGLGGYGALSEHRLSWGGGDMHIGIKPWLLGFKNWAVPCRPGIHIGPFPSEKLDGNASKVGKSNYRLWSISGEGPSALGFLVSCYVLGGVPMMERNEQAINDRFGRFLRVRRHWEDAIDMGRNEREWLLKRQKMSFDELLLQKPWSN